MPSDEWYEEVCECVSPQLSLRVWFTPSATETGPVRRILSTPPSTRLTSLTTPLCWRRWFWEDRQGRAKVCWSTPGREMCLRPEVSQTQHTSWLISSYSFSSSLKLHYRFTKRVLKLVKNKGCKRFFFFCSDSIEEPFFVAQITFQWSALKITMFS